ncbi:hypothetical protein M2133_002473 [Parabacteroides sp. PF5-6]|nr:hypothetical protein [Parabacteroides sp. PF5-6]
MELTFVQSKIYEIRNQRVMLDFMFQLTKTEWNELVAICDQLPINRKQSDKPRNPIGFVPPKE